MQQRSVLLLLNATKSEATFKCYFSNLRRFKEYFKIKDYDSLAKIAPAKINEMIEDYLMYLRNKVSPNTIPTMYYGIELFFSMNDVVLNVRKLRRMFPAKVKRTGGKPYTTEDIQKILGAMRHKRDKALIYFLSSTGARVGVVEDLKMKNIENMPDGCKSVLCYENAQEEYYTFLTPEASKALDEYYEERVDDGERLSPNSPVFRTVYAKGILKAKPLQLGSCEGLIYRAVKKARLHRTRSGKWYDIQIDMGFRKRFNTILKLNNSVNSNIAEKLMNHKRGLDGAYLTPTREECFEEFRKAIPKLSIDDSLRLKEEIKKKDELIETKESEKDAIIKDYGTRIVNTEKMLLELQKRLDSKK